MNNYVRGPADPYTPEPYVLRGLHNLDNNIRIRWSQRFGQWQVERKVSHAVSYIKTLAQYVHGVENDSWVRARDGYILVRSFGPQPTLGDWALTVLQWGDPWRVTRAHRELALLRQEERQEQEKTNAFHTHVEAVAKDQYDDMVWRGGERVAGRTTDTWPLL